MKKKLSFLFAMLAVMVTTAFADNVISASDLKIATTGKADLLINLTNTEVIKGVQFTLTLPEGVSVVEDSDNGIVYNNEKIYTPNDGVKVSLTDRFGESSKDWSVIGRRKSESTNTYVFVLISFTGAGISAGEGSIMIISLETSGVDAGTYNGEDNSIKINDIHLASSTGVDLALKSVTKEFTVFEIQKGDVNADGDVNVTDVVAIVNYILGKPNSNFNSNAADLNNDGEINVTDVVAVVNIILGRPNASSRAMSRAMVIDNDRMMLEETKDGLSLGLDNQERYVAAQMDVRLSDGQTLASVALNQERKSGHQLSWSEIGDGHYRVLAYSIGCNSFLGHSGELMSFMTEGSGEVTIENITLVTGDLKVKHFADLNSYSRGTTGIDAIDAQVDFPADIYDTSGRLLYKDATTIKNLKSGVYIINGKKVIIK